MSSHKRAAISDNDPLDRIFVRSKSSDREQDSTAHQDGNRISQDTLKQTTFQLYSRHSTWLAQKCIEAGQDGGKAIRKAAIMRALIDLAMNAPVDLSGLKDDEEIVERIEQAIKEK